MKELEKIRVEDRIARLVTRLLYAKPEGDGRGVRRDCMFLPHEFGPMWVTPASQELDSRIGFFSPDAINDPEICWPMNIGYVHEKITENGPEIAFNYWESVDAKSLRGRIRLTGRKNIAWSHGRLGPDNRFLSARMYAAWTGSRWKTCPLIRFDKAFMRAVPDAGMAPLERHLDKGEDNIGEMAALGQSVALTFRYEWGAQFQLGKSPRVIVPTTPRGILELFNDRDKPETQDRRKALKHWVREHVRKSQSGDFHSVMAHLRGELKFRWRGFDVQIRPSAFDLESIEKNRKGAA